MKFSELLSQYTPQTTPEEVELGIKVFDRREEFRAQANFRIVHDGTHIDFLVKACHATMSATHNGDLEIRSRAAIVTENASVRCYDSDNRREEIHGRYLRWLTKESCFTPFFMPMGDDFAYQNGFVISGDLPTTVVQNMLLCCRFFAECAEKGFEIFNELYDLYGGDVAFHIVSGSALSQWGPFPEFHTLRGHSLKGDDILVTPRSWHTVTPLFSNLYSFKNFLHRDAPLLINRKNTHYRKYASVYGGAKMWDAEVTQFSNFIQEFVEKHPDVKKEIKETRRGPVDVVKNPFLKRTNESPPNYTNYRWSELRNTILPAMKEKGIFNVS